MLYRIIRYLAVSFLLVYLGFFGQDAFGVPYPQNSLFVSERFEWILRDGQGSLRRLVKTTGELGYQRHYRNYGSDRWINGHSFTTLGFHGVRQAVDGTYRMGARVYIPGETGSDSGSWLSPDPLLQKVDVLNRPMTQNPYLAFDGNPVSKRDPSGLAAFYSTYQNDFGHANLTDMNMDLMDGVDLLADILDGSNQPPPASGSIPEVVFDFEDFVACGSSLGLMVGGVAAAFFFPPGIIGQGATGTAATSSFGISFGLGPCRDLPDGMKEGASFLAEGIIFLSQNLNASSSESIPTIGQLGQPLGEGGVKQVYLDVTGKKAIGVPKIPDFNNAIHQELQELDLLRKTGAPTIRAELARFRGQPAVLYHDLYAANTKDPGWVRYISDLTAPSFNGIVGTLQKADLGHHDFQLGVLNDGRLLLVDPQGVTNWNNHRQFRFMDEIMDGIARSNGWDLFDQLEYFPIKNDPDFDDWWGVLK